MHDIATVRNFVSQITAIVIVGLAGSACLVGDDDIQPTPVVSATQTASVHTSATIEAVQSAMPFRVVMPEDLSQQLAADEVEITQATPNDGQSTVSVVIASFRLTDNDHEWPLLYRQAQQPLSNPGEQFASQLQVDGVSVYKAVNNPVGFPSQAVYWWETDGVYREVGATLTDGVTENHLSQLVEAIIDAQG